MPQLTHTEALAIEFRKIVKTQGKISCTETTEGGYPVFDVTEYMTEVKFVPTFEVGENKVIKGCTVLFERTEEDGFKVITKEIPEVNTSDSYFYEMVAIMLYFDLLKSLNFYPTKRR